MKPLPQSKELVVAYARYSSEGQSDESIVAQLRAIHEYAEKNNMRIIREYIDRAKTATNDQRPEFQQMVLDSERKRFKKVLVHKIDRFSRNNTLALMYIDQLDEMGIKVVSTTERFDDSPSGLFLRDIMLAQSQLFSRNLGTEVEKGKRESAYKGKHVGGVPPLGYDVDHDTMKLIVNEREAQAVRLIFSMYLEGKGYNKIIDELNLLGYKTKRGQPFGKNSLHEILRNEKYTGTYVYNRTKKRAGEKYNRHKIKPDSDIIRVEDAHPALVSREDFDRIALKMKENRKNASRMTAKEVYLLSGKIVCGDCGSKYTGFNRPAREGYPKQYVSYRCSKRNGSIKCKNPEIRREAVELFILDKLANHLFSDEMSERIFKGYATQFQIRVSEAKEELVAVQNAISTLSEDIEKLIDLMLQTGYSVAMEERRKSMEDRMEQLKDREEELSILARPVLCMKSVYTRALMTAKKQLCEGKLAKTRDIIERFVDVVTVCNDHITVTFNIDGAEDSDSPQKKHRRYSLAPVSNTAVSHASSTNPEIDTMIGRGRRT